MEPFDAKTWVAQFEAVGGLITAQKGKDGPELWLGVITRRPDKGSAAREMEREVDGHPDWYEPLLAFACERLRIPLAG